MYFYFGGDNFIILGLFALLALFLSGFLVLSVKVLLALKNIIRYIKKRGEK
jgi:hypothetical protein